jgi:monovalent cation:H+ antiporter, CPA1 family
MVDLLTVLIVLTAFASFLNHKWMRLPDTIGVMVVTLGVSLFLVTTENYFPAANRLAQDFVTRLDISETILHGMLGFFLFAGALHVNLGDLKDRAGPIVLLAVFGTLLSTILVGIMTWAALSALGIPIALVYCFMFGALISPTDPIAVLSLLKEARISKQTEIQIAGESLFNDGTAVVLFISLLRIATSGESFHFGDTLVLFFREAFGGILFGLLTGGIAYWMCLAIDHAHIETLISLALASGTYIAADKLGLSGALSVVVAGLLMGNHGRTLAMSPATVERLDTFWEMIDDLLNGMLFVVIGLEVLILDFDFAYLVAGLVASISVLAARLLSVAASIALVQHRYLFSRGTVMITTWAGLRGALSVAMALSLPDQSPAGSTHEHDIILSMTYVVVVTSILVQGLTMRPFARYFQPNGDAQPLG